MAGLGALTVDLSANITRFERAMTRAERIAQKRTNAIRKTFTRMAGAISGLLAGTAVIRVFDDMVNVARKFEQSVADLSAITGATGKDLEFLSDAAKEFGKSTTLSASQAAEAFKLVASAKPDLLDNANALKEVTRQTIILAEASGLDLTDAASSVGEALNQFGVEADQANRFVNVLAASAKFGSSEIGNTAIALEAVGVVAKNSGLSFEQTNAALQLIAKGGIQAAKAGTGLRTVLLRLTTQADAKINPAIVGMEKALNNLAAANLSAKEQIELFGREGITTAQVLIDNSQLFEQYEKNVTGTSVATEQAAIRTATFDGKLRQLNSAFESFQLSLTSTNSLLGKFVDLITQSINFWTAFINRGSGFEQAAEDIKDANLELGKLLRQRESVRTQGLLARWLYGTEEELDAKIEETRAKLKQLTDDFLGANATFSSGFVGPRQPPPAGGPPPPPPPPSPTPSAVVGIKPEQKLLNKLFPNEKHARDLQKNIELLGKLELPIDKASEAMKRLIENYDQLILGSDRENLYDNLFPNEKHARDLNKNIDLLGKMNLPADKAAEAMKRLIENYDQLITGQGKLADESEKASTKISEAISAAGASIETSITDAVFAAELSLKSLESLAGSILSSIARQFIQAEIVRPGVTALSSAFAAEGKAAGGPVSAGRTYLVGERGPELLHMGAGSNGNISNKIGSGGGTVVNVVNNSSEKSSVSRSNDASGRELINVVIGQITRDITSDGPFGQTIKNTYGLNRQGILRA